MKKHLLLLSLCLPFVANAQDDSPSKYIRFIPLGERPTWGEDIIDEVRVERENVPGAKPPADFSIATSGKDFETHNMRLREFTKVIKVKTSAKGLNITEGKNPGGKEFIKSRFPAKPYSLGVLYRDNTDMTWLKPKLMVLPEDLSSFPLGKIRFVNTSPFEVAVKFGEERAFPVKPGKAIYKTLKVGETQAVIAVKNSAGAYKRMLTNNITMGRKQRIQAFFYKAQGKSPKSPVKIHIKPETYQAPPRR